MSGEDADEISLKAKNLLLYSRKWVCTWTQKRQRGAEVLDNLVQDDTVQMPISKVVKSVPAESQFSQEKIEGLRGSRTSQPHLQPAEQTRLSKDGD